MDHQSHEHQNQKTLSHKFPKAKFLKQVTKLLLSVSVFSLFFSHSTWFSLPIRLISHNLDKNYIFLLCNGLLVFLAKFSGLLSSSSSKHNNNNNTTLTNEYYNDFKPYADESPSEGILMETEDNSAKEKAFDHQDVEGESHEEVKQEEQEVAEETKYVIEEDDEEEIKEPEAEDEETEREEHYGILSTEDLNKKIEDFIRKRKEEQRIEARQQLVMV